MVPRESSCCCTEGLWVEMSANSSLMTWSRVLPSGGSTVQHVSLTLGFCYNKTINFSPNTIIFNFNVSLTPLLHLRPYRPTLHLIPYTYTFNFIALFVEFPQNIR